MGDSRVFPARLGINLNNSQAYGLLRYNLYPALKRNIDRDKFRQFRMTGRPIPFACFVVLLTIYWILAMESTRNCNQGIAFVASILVYVAAVLIPAWVLLAGQVFCPPNSLTQVNQPPSDVKLFPLIYGKLTPSFEVIYFVVGTVAFGIYSFFHAGILFESCYHRPGELQISATFLSVFPVVSHLFMKTLHFEVFLFSWLISLGFIIALFLNGDLDFHYFALHFLLGLLAIEHENTTVTLFLKDTLYQYSNPNRKPEFFIPTGQLTHDHHSVVCDDGEDSCIHTHNYGAIAASDGRAHLRPDLQQGSSTDIALRIHAMVHGTCTTVLNTCHATEIGFEILETLLPQLLSQDFGALAAAKVRALYATSTANTPASTTAATATAAAAAAASAAGGAGSSAAVTGPASVSSTPVCTPSTTGSHHFTFNNATITTTTTAAAITASASASTTTTTPASAASGAAPGSSLKQHPPLPDIGSSSSNSNNNNNNNNTASQGGSVSPILSSSATPTAHPHTHSLPHGHAHHGHIPGMTINTAASSLVHSSNRNTPILPDEIPPLVMTALKSVSSLVASQRSYCMNLLQSMKATSSYTNLSINSMRDVVTVLSGVELMPSYEVFNVAETVMTMVNCMSDLQSAIRIAVISIPDTCNAVFSDKRWFENNVLSLISNAIHLSMHFHMEDFPVELVVSIKDFPSLSSCSSTCASSSGSTAGAGAGVDGGKISVTNAAAGSTTPTPTATATATATANEKMVSMVLVELSDIGSLVSQELLNNAFLLPSSSSSSSYPSSSSSSLSPYTSSPAIGSFTGDHSSAGFGDAVDLFALGMRVKALGGHYGARRRTDGVDGSVFWFALPYLKSTSRPPVTKAAPARSGRPTSKRSLLTPNVSSNFVQDSMLSEVLGEKSDCMDDMVLVDGVFTRVGAAAAAGAGASTAGAGVANTGAAAGGGGGGGGGTESESGETVVPLQVKMKAAQRLSILLVDGSISMLKIAALSLQRLGHNVETAANGGIALAMMMEKEYDVVIMDVNAPILDGYETVTLFRQQESSCLHLSWPYPSQELSRHKKQIIIGIGSDSYTDGARRKCLLAGMDAYVQKPISMQKLVKTVADLRSGGASAAGGQKGNAALSTVPSTRTTMSATMGSTRHILGSASILKEDVITPPQPTSRLPERTGPPAHSISMRMNSAQESAFESAGTYQQ